MIGAVPRLVLHLYTAVGSFARCFTSVFDLLSKSLYSHFSTRIWTAGLCPRIGVFQMTTHNKNWAHTYAVTVDCSKLSKIRIIVN